VRHVFGRLLEKAELRQMRLHDLRHTFATLLLQANAPITYVSQQLGHREPSITFRVYAYLLAGRVTPRRRSPRYATICNPLQREAALLIRRRRLNRLK
jgi:integrase